MLDSSCPIPQMPYYLFILPSVFVNEAPRALIAKTKATNHESDGNTFRGPTFLPHV